MASIAFPIGAAQPAVNDQGAPPPNENAGLRAVDPNRPNVAPQDSVTLSGAFPPTQAVQQASFVKIEEFTVFVAETNTQAGPNAAGNTPGAAAPQPAAQAAAQAPAQAPAQAAPAQANPVANNVAPAALESAGGNGAANSSILSTPQQQLQQLDTTLREMGFDPQSISLFNRLGLLLYANDPAALHNLVNALQAVDQQLQQLGALTNSSANNTNPAGAPVQDLLPPKLAALQQNANIVPEPLTPLRQGQPAAQPAQLQNQEAPNNTTTESFAAQLSFTEIQGSVQVQAPANQPAGANTGAAAQNQTNSATVQFQELQLSFQAVEIQQQQQNAPTNSNGQNQGVNLTV